MMRKISHLLLISIGSIGSIGGFALIIGGGVLTTRGKGSVGLVTLFLYKVGGFQLFPFIMFICPYNEDGKRYTAFIFSRRPEGRGLSYYLPIAISKQFFARGHNNHLFEQAFKKPFPLPSLEPLVQNAAGNMEPFFFDGFPLAFCPKHMPDAIQNILVTA